jgi:hypothetical protein
MHPVSGTVAILSPLDLSERLTGGFHRLDEPVGDPPRLFVPAV